MDGKNQLSSFDNIKMPDERKKVVLDRILSQVNVIESSQKRKSMLGKQYILKYSVAVAVLFVLILGTKIIYPFSRGVQNNSNIAKITPIYTSSPETTTTQRLTARERIIKEKEYGVVSLSHRSSEEINTLIQRGGITNNTLQDVNCYEDEKYIYVFYDDGRVAGVKATYLDDPDSEANSDWSEKKLSEEEAVLLAQNALQKYCDSYTAETKDRFIPEIWNSEEDDTQYFPEWRITFAEYTESGICRNTIEATIDIYGNIAELSFGIRSNVSDEELMSKEYITKEDVISFALVQFEKEKINIDLKHFKVSATLFERNGSVVWELNFEELEDDGYLLAYQQIYSMTFDAISGKWIATDRGRSIGKR